MLRDAAIAGLGIALLPTSPPAPAIKAGILIAIDVGARRAGVRLCAIRRDGALRQMRAFIECLRAAFGDPPYWTRADGAAHRQERSNFRYLAGIRR